MQLIGGAAAALTPEQVTTFVEHAVASLDIAGRSVCVLVPDSTRSCPLPLLLSAVHRAVHGRASRLTILVALGTHPAMSDADVQAWVGGPYADTTVVQHAWWSNETFVSVGTLSAARVADLSNGVLEEAVDVRVNRAVTDHDVCLVVGPVFPHEVVGFSGGDKYFFPGVSGPEVIGVSHWLGALIGSRHIIGSPGITPVRRLIHAAAELLPTRRACLAVVVTSGAATVNFAAFSEPPREAWQAAADISAQLHVRRLDAPVTRVLSIVSQRYDEMWTAAKGFYKVEPAVADGGEVTLFAPHVREISRTFHHQIAEVGYHSRGYLLAHLGELSHIPRSVLAHSTHVRGDGTYDVASGERTRVRLVLATGLDEDLVRKLGVEWRDPATVDVSEWANDPDALVVENAGEVLYVA